jgi:hypothetical protein
MVTVLTFMHFVCSYFEMSKILFKNNIFITKYFQMISSICNNYICVKERSNLKPVDHLVSVDLEHKYHISLLLHEQFPCKMSAICLHYLWLTAFMWTLVDSVHLYRMLTEMRDINHGPMRFYYTMGYGLPAVVLGLSVGVRADQYGNFYL